MTAPFECADRRSFSSARWADLTEEEQAEQALSAEPPLAEAVTLTVESLPRLPRKAPGAVFHAAMNLYKDVLQRKVSYHDAVRWSRRLEAPSGSWLRRVLLPLKPPARPPRATDSVGKVQTKPLRYFKACNS